MTNARTDIRDIKGLVPVPHDWWWLWLVLAVVAIAALALWWWRRRRLMPAAGEAPVPLSPYELARRALRQLREENPVVEEFYTKLSDIVRHYLENQMGLRAPERTTEEFLHEVSHDHALLAEHKELLGAFLEESDLVKFARFRPGEEDKERAFAAAEKFVEESSAGATSLSPGQEPVAAGKPLPQKEEP
ncbi:MAG TPA: hypothetical protein VL171_04980 [Verrucomicrobiae bacterium]|nr:hypothetical protein [Verrucomicrobiae bacterium]